MHAGAIAALVHLILPTLSRSCWAILGQRKGRSDAVQPDRTNGKIDDKAYSY